MSVTSPAEQPVDASASLAHAVYERHHRHLYVCCLSLLGSPEDAEEAVQQTFLNAIRGLQRGVVPQSETAWLRAIARNVCRERRRSAVRRRRVETPHDLHALQDALPARAGDTGDAAAALTEAVRALEPSQRRAVVLREWHGLSYHEIASLLDRSPRAVEALLLRARRSLALALDKDHRLRRGLNLGSLLTPLRTLLSSGAAKTAAVLVATGATVAAAPTVGHAVADLLESPPGGATSTLDRPAVSESPGNSSARRPLVVGVPTTTPRAARTPRPTRARPAHGKDVEAAPPSETPPSSGHGADAGAPAGSVPTSAPAAAAPSPLPGPSESTPSTEGQAKPSLLPLPDPTDLPALPDVEISPPPVSPPSAELPSLDPETALAPIVAEPDDTVASTVDTVVDALPETSTTLPPPLP